MWASVLLCLSALPVPQPAEQQQALALFHQVYDREIDAARTAADKAALAGKILDRAAGMKGAAGTKGAAGMKGAELYVSLWAGRNLACEAGDVDAALRAVELLAGQFEIDVQATRGEALENLARSVRFTDQKKRLSEKAADCVPAALADDALDIADRMVEIALAAVASARDPALLRRIRSLQDEVRARKDAYAPVPDAQAVLEKNPTDSAANRIVGTWLCVWKRDWVHGVPMLALGDDVRLQKPAAAEMAEPRSVDAIVALGDGWWDAGQASSGPTRDALLYRAGHWYMQAISQLDDGLEKIRIQKRMEQVDAAGHLPDVLAGSTVVFVNHISQHTVSVSRGSRKPGATVIQWSRGPQDATKAGQWIVEPVDSHCLRLRNVNSRLWLGTADGSDATAPMRATQTDVPGSDALWELRPLSKGFVAIVHHDTGLCLGQRDGSKARGQGIYLYPFDPTWWRLQWQVEPVPLSLRDDDEGDIVLCAGDAEMIGDEMHYSDMIDCTCNWRNPREYVQWSTSLEPGVYDVTLRYASRGAGGGYAFAIGAYRGNAPKPLASVVFMVRSTGGWETISSEKLGTLPIRVGGDYTLRLQAIEKRRNDDDPGLLNIREVRLKPHP